MFDDIVRGIKKQIGINFGVGGIPFIAYSCYLKVVCYIFLSVYYILYTNKFKTQKTILIANI